MASIVFTGINWRSVLNWLPALRLLAARGHLVQSIQFPHLRDPDSQSLANDPFPRIGTFPLEIFGKERGRAISPGLAQAALKKVRKARPDVLILTCCHGGPELELARALMSRRSRPAIIGCQHGFAQKWNFYWRNFHFDQLFVFGPHFARGAPQEFRDKVTVAGFGKLDGIETAERPLFSQDRRPILFAAQRLAPPPGKIDLLCSLQRESGRRVLVRHHPQHRHLFKNLPEALRLANIEHGLDAS